MPDASAGTVGAICGELHVQLREAAAALRLPGAAGSGEGGTSGGAINPWFEFDATQQHQEYQARLAVLKATLKNYQARARAGESVAIRRVLVANRDAEAAERRQRDLQGSLEECKRLLGKHVRARKGGASAVVSSPFAGGITGAPILHHLEAAAADLELDKHLEVNGATKATMTLSSEAILIDIGMSKAEDQDVRIERVTVQLMHAQRGQPHVWDDAPQLAARDWAAFRRQLALAVQNAALAAVSVEVAGAKSATPEGAKTAAMCLEAVEADVRSLVAHERQLEASSKTTATARLVRGCGLLENAARAADADTSAGRTLRALWIYAEPATFAMTADQHGKQPAARSDDDSHCLRSPMEVGIFGAVRMVLALERAKHSTGVARAMQAASWIKNVSPHTAGQVTDGILSIEFLPQAARATASEVLGGKAGATASSSVTVSAQLLEPLVVAPRTLAALQALSAVNEDGVETSRASPRSRGDKRKRDCADSNRDSGTGESAVSSLSELLLPTPCVSSSRQHWDIAWHSPSDAGGSGGYRLQRFVASGGRADDRTCGLMISRLPCCADVVTWQKMVGLLRQQATWNTLYSSCFRAIAPSELVGAAEDGAVVFELSSNSDSTSPELLSLRFIHRTSSKASRSLQMLMLTLRVGVGGTVEPTLASSSTSSSNGADSTDTDISQELDAELEVLRAQLADVLTKTHQLPVALAMVGLGCVAGPYVPMRAAISALSFRFVCL